MTFFVQAPGSNTSPDSIQQRLFLSLSLRRIAVPLIHGMVAIGTGALKGVGLLADPYGSNRYRCSERGRSPGRPMSALPPKADILERIGVSALGQKRTFVHC